MKNICLLFCAVALAAQGTAHTVTFRRLNGTVLSRVEVAHGGSVVAPEGPVEANFIFKGWDHGDCRIYTNTNADNTVAYDAPPPAAKLAAPVNATAWRGWDMTWGRPGSGAYQGNISKGYGERSYIKTALSQYFAREKTDILMFLTDPTVVTGENSGQFDIPGYTMVFMSANANDYEPQPRE